MVPVPTIDEAIALVPGLVSLGASAVELMVAPALTVAGQAFRKRPPTGKPSIPKPLPCLSRSAPRIRTRSKQHNSKSSSS